MTSPLQQKLKITGPVVITANRVVDGAVVYRHADGHWTTHLDNAAVATSAPQAGALLAASAADARIVVDAYMAPVRLAAAGGIAPGNLREAIRARGPTFALPVTSGH
jgi:hypothetical protein